jgi:cob(I)alamin adenosyltransferase
MKIYTRKGDDGSTSLAGGRRVPKFNLRIEACGSVDELLSWLGLLRDFKENSRRRNTIIYIQDQLMKCAVTLASEKVGETNVKHLPDITSVSLLESEIDSMEAKLPEVKNFVLPGGSVLVSYCNIARSVCRRTERVVVNLNNAEEVPDIVVKFLNRLSDYLFVLSRIISLELDNKEIIWSV